MVLGRSDPGLVLTGQREDTIRTIRQLGGRGRQKGSSYTERSPLVWGNYIQRQARHESRSAQPDFLSQQTETDLACSVLNKMTRLGKPDGSCVTWATSAAQNEKTHLFRHRNKIS